MLMTWWCVGLQLPYIVIALSCVACCAASCCCCLFQVFPLSEAAAAHQQVETGHTRGKVVLQIP